MPRAIRRVIVCGAICMALTLLLFDCASMEFPFSWDASRHEFRFLQWTMSQQMLDMRCGLPQMLNARGFYVAKPGAASTPARDVLRGGGELRRSAIVDESASALTAAGIHYVLAVPESATCPADVPTKYACSVESAIATRSPVSIWVIHPTRTCALVERNGYALRPLILDHESILGAWYHSHTKELWSEGYRTSLSLVSNFLRLYVLLQRGGGTYLDFDVHVLDPEAFNTLPESVAAQEQPTSLKFHGLHRYNNAFMRLHSTSALAEGLAVDWVNEWLYKGTHRGYTGPAAVTRVVNQMLATHQCSTPGLALLGMDSVYGLKVGDTSGLGADAVAFHSKLDDWVLSGKYLSPQRSAEVQRACPRFYQRMSSGDWAGRIERLSGLGPP